MRRLTVLSPAFALVAACGGGSTKQEDTLSERTTEPDGPAGRDSERGSGTGGDSLPPR
jgi:hypothetical protein